MIRPLGARAVVKPLKPPEMSAGGVYVISGQHDQKTGRGEVIAVGEIPTVYVGAEVYYPKYAGNTVEDEGVEYLSLTEDEILGVIE